MTTAAVLGQFLVGYLAVLAAPGPNMLAIGVLSALRGFRAVLPFVVGIATGAAALAIGLLVAFGFVDGGQEAARVARAIGGVLLLLVALRVLRAPAPVAPDAPAVAQSAGGALVGFGAGFATAATNPITATYFVSQFLGPLADDEVAPFAVPLAALEALAVGLFVAHAFSRPGPRRAVLAWHRIVCAVAGGALAALALGMLLPAVNL